MRDLVDFIDNEEVFPSHAQTIRMRALSKDGKLDREAIDTIMNEEKPNQKARMVRKILDIANWNDTHLFTFQIVLSFGHLLSPSLSSFSCVSFVFPRP